MDYQFDNLALASFILWANHQLLKKGNAYTNVSSNLYPVSSLYNGLYTYATPYKPLVSDFSISGAVIPTGLYVNGSFVQIGQNGLVDINYQEGQAYFSVQPIGNVSGNYSVQDTTIEMTDEPDEILLFETKFEVKPRIGVNTTGISPNSKTFPIIYVKSEGGQNKPFSFGGTDNTQLYIRGLSLTDSQFLLDAINCIYRDSNFSNIPLLTANEMPFNNLGGFRSGILYNYATLTANKALENSLLYVSSVIIPRFSIKSQFFSDFKNVNPRLFVSVIEWVLENPRTPRLQ